MRATSCTVDVHDLAVHPDARVQDAAQHPHAFEDLQRARLHANRFGVERGIEQRIDDPAADAVAGQFDGCGQTDGAGTGDQDRSVGGIQAHPGEYGVPARASGAVRADTPARPPRKALTRAAYRKRVARTSSKTSPKPRTGRLSNRFWKLLGASTDKDQTQSMGQVERSAEFDAKAAELDDEQLRKAAQLLELEDLADSADIPQFLAIAREAAERTTTLRPFDVQLQAALRMLAGDVVEMATGEGKTLSGAIAAAGYALAGRSVHVITINDYLARRDAEWMGPLIEAMGLTVGWITADSTAAERREAYQCDVTYASVNEIGFDVLRDQLVTDVDDLVSPNPDVALIDEADSVLVDEALVPLVLAGTSHRETPRVELIRLVGELTEGKDFDTDSDSRNVHLTEAGAQKVEAKLGGIDLYSEEHVGTTLTEVNVALHAHVLLQRDVHYIVRDDAVHLINASRGRIATLQRWPDGLQAAVEAKEGIETTETGEVLDTITVQALINRYPTVCGMTGTALAAGEQLRQFYKLGVSPIPPNTPNIREDETDRVYVTVAAKNDAIVEHIADGARDRPAGAGRHPRRRRVRGTARAAGEGRRARGGAERQERRRGGRRHRRGGQARRGDGVHADGRPRHRHPAGRIRRGRPRRGRRTRRAARHRHRPPPHRAAGQPAARPRRAPGRPRLVGVLLQLGGRRRGRAPRGQQAAAGLRRGRPGAEPEGGEPARTRPADRRGSAARRARQHLALQPADRPAARDPRRAPRHAAAHRDRTRGAGRAVAGRATRSSASNSAQTATRSWRRSAG